MIQSRTYTTVMKHSFVIRLSFKSLPVPDLAMNYVIALLPLITVLFIASFNPASADRHIPFDDQVAFGASIEEAIGHFRALELNLDDGNAGLAAVHATHPIAELYDLMKPTIAAADPTLDARLHTTLEDLKDRTGPDVSRAEAQIALDEARDLVEEVRHAVIDDRFSEDTNFQLLLMHSLLETSAAEYGEAVSGGMITEMAEFQDGSAFVWRSQVIFAEIRDDLSGDDAEYISHGYEELNEAYDDLSHPSEVNLITSGILSRINSITGDVEMTLLDYVAEINMLLMEAKSEYRAGNSDTALSLVTRAYLDNYEFLEAPLVDLGEPELMVEIEILMREELRNMIRDGASVSDVDAQIDLILEKMDTVAVIVPEFGVITIMILTVAVIAVVIFGVRAGPSLVYRT